MKKIALIISSILVLNSCKKENKTPDTTPASTPAITTGSVMTNGLPQNVSAVDGILKADYVFQIVNNGGFYYSEAALYNNPLSFYTGYIYSQVGDLSNDVGDLQINNTILKKDDSNNPPNLLYADTTMNPNYASGVTWLLNSSSSFPSFTTTVTRGFPGITGNVALPDTASISSGFTINLPNGGFSNTDSISVFIVGSASFYLLNKSFAGNATSLVITPNDLAGFTSGQIQGAIYLYAKNFSHQTLNTKTLVYVMQKTWVNELTFIP